MSNIIHLQIINTFNLNIIYSSNIFGTIHDIRIHILSDDSGFIFIAQKLSSQNPYFCKQIVTPSLSIECKEITTIYYCGFGSLKITDDVYFFSATDTTTYNLHYYKMKFSSGSVEKASVMSYPDYPSITVSSSESMLSSDGSLIYTFISYGNPKYVFFNTFNFSDLSIVGTRYKSSIEWRYIIGGTLNGDILAVTPLWVSGNYLMMFNIVTSEFKIKLFEGNRLQQLANEPSIGR